MKEDNLEDVFKSMQGGFDLHEPAQGHEQRFLEKLQQQKQETVTLHKKKTHWRKPLSIAASVLLLLSVGVYTFVSQNKGIDAQVAEIAPEVSQTEFYFSNVINKQVEKLKEEATPETKQIINDALVQLKRLEENYKTLEQDLINGGNSKLILSAMITNFQTRIDLLQDVLEQVENIKNLNHYDDENYTI